MRNAERDAKSAETRRNKLMEAGFRLFSERTIEAVTLNEVAEDAHVGIATLYRYFDNKPNLVIAIATQKWIEYSHVVADSYERRGGDNMTAAERLEHFLDSFIDLYRNHRDILVFNRNFDTYVKHEHCTHEQMAPYNDAVTAFAKRFGTIITKAKEDETLEIRTSGRKLFVNLLYIMLSVSGKYAEGLIYPEDYKQDMTEELYMLKQMILDMYVKK